MPQCRLCGYDAPGGTPRCPGCGAWLADQADRSPGEGIADGSPTADDFESRLLQLLREGQKIGAIKLYREETGVGLKEAKDAVESLATRHGVVIPRAGCLGVLLLVGVLWVGMIAAMRATGTEQFADPPVIEAAALGVPSAKAPQSATATQSRDAAGATAAEAKPKRWKATELVKQNRVLVIAHRGDSGAFPENTLPAFESAAKLPADLVELDYHHSSDGVPIVIHDKDLDRTTDAVARWGRKGVLVAEKSATDLRTLDAGRWFDAKFTGTKLPTLEAALDSIQPHSITLIERKAGDAATCVRIVKAKGILDRVVVQAFDWSYLADCRRLAPTLTLVALGRDKLTEERLQEVVKLGASGVGWADKDVDREAVEAVHRRGLKLWVFTIDDQRRGEQLLDWGVDGLITNVPKRMQEVVAKQSLGSR